MSDDLVGKNALDSLIRKLTWQADDRVINPFGEDVYLKAVFDDSGRQIYITDCCNAEETAEYAGPCERHAAIAASRSVEGNRN